MRDRYNWNPVYNLVMKIKDDYTYNIRDGDKLFGNWIAKLNKKEYNDIFNYLQLNQDGNILLIRYGLHEMQRGLWKNKDSIFRECRSIVIDLESEEIILAPFRKFFNLDEVEENNLHNVFMEIQKAKSVEITDKLDGSMQSARYYNGDVFMAGSMAINKDNSWRLKDGYSMLKGNHRIMLRENKNITFIFEYISLKDTHVVSYKKSQQGLYLIGARDITNGRHFSYKELKEYANKYNVPMTKIENKSIDDILVESRKLKSDKKEGWVINIDEHMIKIKCDDYVKLHRILDKVSSINVIIENVAEDRVDDMLSKIPLSHKERITKIIDIIMKYKEEKTKEVYNYYNKAPKDTKKNFMVWVDNNCPKELIGCIKNIYLGRSFNVLKSRCGNYKKLSDLGLENIIGKFEV